MKLLLILALIVALIAIYIFFKPLFKQKQPQNTNPKKSNQLQKEATSSTKKTPYQDLFDSKFIKEYTSFESIEELFTASEFQIKSKKDLDSIPQDKWNEFIRKHTSFFTWKEMIQQAGEEWFTKRSNF
ncbi:hypothetical protein [Fuchsiella alkaliacetigena]|uniref:hypothetical protein n=1 Tax=Fuchsiella alkaliacetigena TaxID=957042 RepID=UPI00200B4EB0|nr:hypothetical protein [Fuchsiella alkaliacetigena]MCK8826045.1 hypothetical protein [Fuchsiella alkaliacetigena]